MLGSKSSIAKRLYDPSAHVDAVAEDPHHAAMVKVSVLIDPLHHNTILYSLPAVGACLSGASDKEIVTTIGRVQKQVWAASQQTAARQNTSTSEQ